MSTGRCS